MEFKQPKDQVIYFVKFLDINNRKRTRVFKTLHGAQSFAERNGLREYSIEKGYRGPSIVEQIIQMRITGSTQYGM